MSESMRIELTLFLLAVGTGALFLFVYDCMQGLRNMIPHRGFLCGAGELCFWIFLAFAVVFLAKSAEMGKIRGFFLGGMALGGWLNYRLVHGVCLEFWCRFWNLTGKLVKKIRKRLLFLGKSCKISMYKFAKLGKRGENRFPKLKRGSKIGKQ